MYVYKLISAISKLLNSYKAITVNAWMGTSKATSSTILSFVRIKTNVTMETPATLKLSFASTRSAHMNATVTLVGFKQRLGLSVSTGTNAHITTINVVVCQLGCFSEWVDNLL